MKKKKDECVELKNKKQHDPVGKLGKRRFG